MNVLKEKTDEISRIREILMDHPKGLTIEEIAKKLPLNRTSTAKYLNTLWISGQAEMMTFGRAKVFTLSERVPFSQILNLSSDLLLVLDHDLLINQVNDSFVKTFCIPRENLLGIRIDHSGLTRFFSKENLDLIRTAQKGSEHIKMDKIEIEGLTYFFRIKLIPVVFDQGGQGLAVILEDLTELKKHQDHLEQLVEERTVELKSANHKLVNEIEEHRKSSLALEQSERKYRQLVENANSIILRTDEHGHITFFSEFAEKFFGFTETEMLGKDLFGTIIQRQTHSKKSLAEQNQEFLRPAKHMMFKETEVIRKNGDPAWVAWTIKEQVDADKSFREFLIVGMDITVLKTYIERSQRLVEKLEIHEIELNAQSQEVKRLQQISNLSEKRCMSNFNSAPAGFFTIDEKGKIIEMNQTGADLIGKTLQQKGNVLLTDFINKKNQEIFSDFLQKIFRHSETQTCIVLLIGNKNTPVLFRGKGHVGDDEIEKGCHILAIELPVSISTSLINRTFPEEGTSQET